MVDFWLQAMFGIEVISGLEGVRLRGVSWWHNFYFQIQTLIIYGAKDSGLGQESLNNLKALPKGKTVELLDASHACYMDKPTEFNNELEKFLKGLE